MANRVDVEVALMMMTRRGMSVEGFFFSSWLLEWRRIGCVWMVIVF